MDKKSDVYERLGRATVIENVLPTKRLERGAEAFASLVTTLQGATRVDAVREYSANLAALPPERASEPPPSFLEHDDLREQVAGFAGAGLLFYQASDDLMALPLEARRAIGGNGSISRVLISEDRLLLETSRIVVQFAEDVASDNVAAILERYRVIAIGRIGFIDRGFRAAVISGNAADVCRALMENDEVEFAEPDFIEQVGQRTWPGDPKIGQQWHLRNNGSGGGTTGADISAEAAWDVTNGTGARLAIVDNGFDAHHEDLAFGSLSGWYRQTTDFVDADFLPGTNGMPRGDHGTACVGMAGATGNNGKGGCGVAWGAETSMVACLPDQVGTQTTLARALAQAADPSQEIEGANPANGAHVIGCSLGPNSAAWSISQTLREAIEFVTRRARNGRGVPLVWACTNGNFPISADKVASHPDVIAVGRSTYRDEDDGSGFGPELAFLAPGVDVLLPSQGNRYRTTTGTSFAAPCAAGVAALILSANPSLTRAQVRQILADTCDKVGSLPYAGGRNERFGFGRINAAAAVRAA
jgi:subtilisin family serine protease